MARSWRRRCWDLILPPHHPPRPIPPPLLKELCHMIIELLYNVAQVGKSSNAMPNIKLINVIIVYYCIRSETKQTIIIFKVLL